MRFLATILVLFSVIANAATLDPSLFSDLRWRMIGPFRGGRVLAVSGVYGQPQHFYFGSVGGGVWETNDAGRTWDPIFDSMPVASIGAMAVAPSDPNIIYVGSGEADMRSDIGYGNGMYKSSDGGKSWIRIGLDDSHQIGKILIDPKNADLVFVAVLGHAYGANEQRGVFRSKDGGKNWDRLLYKDANTGAIDLAFGSDSRTIYAALWQTRRPPWNVYPPSKGPNSGLYKSTDGGDTWAPIMANGFPTENLGRIGIAVASSNPQIIYAILDATAGGLYRSDDGGIHWSYRCKETRIWQRGWYFGSVTVDPKNPDIIYMMNTGIYKSADGGKTVFPFRGAPGGDDYHSLWIDPADSNRMIAAVDQGAIITLNGGATWSSWFNEPIGQFYHAITDQQFPYWVYGAQQDSGAAAVPSRTGSESDGINMMQFREIRAGGENGYISPDPLDFNIIYGGSVEKLDRRTEQTSDVNPTFAYPDIYRSEWTLPLTFSPRNPHVLYFANQYLFSTDDGGKHWSRLSGDMTREKLNVPPNLDPITANDTEISGERRAVIYSIAPSRLRDHEIWIGTDDGLVWVTKDEGAHWQNMTWDDLVPWSKVAIIETSHFDPDRLYIVIDRHRVDDYKPYIYRTTDGGKTWALISNGIPDGHFVNVVREDPKKKGLLYAGTELGMYVSFDDGDHWQPFQMNLPVTSIRDIDVHGDDLVIGTHGRAFWILDNITPLRQITADVLQTDAYLFQPAEAYRIRPEGFTGTPLPKDEPIATNPPFGAIIDYHLKNDSNSAVTLDILNVSGEVVRHYSSEDQPSSYDIKKIVVTPNWFPEPQVLSKKKGMHRFIWDLHYALPSALAEESKDGTGPNGIWALPGQYQIKLTVAGHPYTQSLGVQLDPRVKVSASDLASQFEFAKKIEAEQVKVAQASDEAKALLKKAEAAAKGSSANLGKKLADFQRETTDTTEVHAVDIEPGIPRYYPQKVGSLRYLSNTLKALAHTVDDSDGAPGADALSGFEKQKAFAEHALKEWEQLKSKWLPQLSPLRLKDTKSQSDTESDF
ncbi:MAG: hypothetical protein C5B54_06470 [Acidobacteria bacterium]|nr:MAG: hypothetical protein C5B54_06470 [Acidobacteriota bacterium]